MWQGEGVHGGGARGGGGHVWWGIVHGGGMHDGGVHGRGHVWPGGTHGGGTCVVSMHGRGHAWQERWPLQQALRILLECILVRHIVRLSKTVNYVSGFLSRKRQQSFEFCSSILCTTESVFSINNFPSVQYSTYVMNKYK